MIKKRTKLEYIIYTVVIAVGIGLDQLTKLLSVLYLSPITTLPIIKDVIHLTYVENRGAAFGMLADQRWVFITVSTVAILAMLAYLYLGHADNMLSAISLSMIISGGIGNMIDRVFVGYVVDFLDFTFMDFPVFNGADCFVCIGAGMLILYLVLDTVREMRADKLKKAEAEKAENGESDGEQ
jgi:signal peptidase II